MFFQYWIEFLFIIQFKYGKFGIFFKVREVVGSNPLTLERSGTPEAERMGRQKRHAEKACFLFYRGQGLGVALGFVGWSGACPDEG